MRPVGRYALDYDAGQLVWLSLDHSPFSLTEHHFSLSPSSASDSALAFTIKEAGDFTNRIGSFAEGTTAYMDAPHGAFTLRGYRDRPLICITGGVRFAPVMGMPRQLAHDGHAHPVHLVYGNQEESQVLYRAEIEALRG